MKQVLIYYASMFFVCLLWIFILDGPNLKAELDKTNSIYQKGFQDGVTKTLDTISVILDKQASKKHTVKLVIQKYDTIVYHLSKKTIGKPEKHFEIGKRYKINPKLFNDDPFVKRVSEYYFTIKVLDVKKGYFQYQVEGDTMIQSDKESIWIDYYQEVK